MEGTAVKKNGTKEKTLQQKEALFSNQSFRNIWRSFGIHCAVRRTVSSFIIV
jgi:hypothetical protein